MSDVKAAGDSRETDMEGWLLKWTNYLKGYQRRWFVLSSGGVLSYYRTENGTSGNSSGVKSVIRRRRKNRLNQAEMSHTCRGTISLHGALIHTVDSCTFVISNGGTQTFHIKTANEVERQSWVTALELAKAKAIRAMESEEDEEEETAHAVPSEELNVALKDIAISLENLRTCYDLIIKHGAALQRALTDLETPGEDLAVKAKTVNERATLFRITSNAMVNVCAEYLKTAESQGQKWSKMLQQERSHSQRLEEMVEQLAKQQRQLEQQAHRIIPNVASSTSDDEENEFYDAQSTTSPIFVSPQIEDSFILKYPKSSCFFDRTGGGSSSEAEGDELQNKSKKGFTEVKQVIVIPEENTDSSLVHLSSSMDETDRFYAAAAVSSTTTNGKVEKKPSKKRRVSVADKPNHSLNLWSIMKNCIGKELTKIPMPVNFNEPLSLLQRLTEDYEYANLLDIAAKCTDPCEQIAYVAAFTISSYSTTANRTGKPFNPLLGETYECDRVDDLGWRVIAEQVSHHPPMAALHCEGAEWTCWQEFTMTSKFRGKYLQITPLGSSNVLFHESGKKYTWKKVTTTVQNIIVGKLWVDHTGEMEIIGRDNAKGIKCHLTYIPYSYFSREAQRRVKGLIMNERNQVKWVLNGVWDSKIEIAPVISTSGSESSPVYKTGAYNIIWTRRLPSPDSEKFYNFTQLAAQLNEMEDGIAPTDSRLRPDQRLMEEGKWDLSNKEKVRLEEKQRSKRREREAEAEQAAKEGRPYPPYESIWFKKQKDDVTDSLVHVYDNKYWECKKKGDWSRCPNIF